MTMTLTMTMAMVYSRKYDSYRNNIPSIIHDCRKQTRVHELYTIHFFIFFRNSEVIASDFLRNIVEMVPR